ncbi:MAG: hypothetical protein ACK5QX_03935 [bacterium]
MPNVSRPNGFRPVKYQNGTPWNGAFRMYAIPAAESTATFVGDLVKLYSGDTTDVVNYPTVQRAAASDACICVVVGFLPDYANLNAAPYRLASTLRLAMVADDPNLLFEAEEDGAVDPLELQDIGNNVNFVATAGSTTTGQSGMVIDSDTHATTATLPLKLMEAKRAADNELVVDGQAATRWIVKINNHQLGSSTGTAGV